MWSSLQVMQMVSLNHTPVGNACLRSSDGLPGSRIVSFAFKIRTVAAT